MRVGNAVKQLRLARGMKQSELAEKSGISLSYISLMERGDRTVSQKSIAALCNALNVHILLLIFLSLDEKERTMLPADILPYMKQWAYKTILGY